MVNGSFRGPKERRSFKPKVAGSTPVGRIPRCSVCRAGECPVQSQVFGSWAGEAFRWRRAIPWRSGASCVTSRSHQDMHGAIGISATFASSADRDAEGRRQSSLDRCPRLGFDCPRSKEREVPVVTPASWASRSCVMPRFSRSSRIGLAEPGLWIDLEPSHDLQALSNDEPKLARRRSS